MKIPVLAAVLLPKLIEEAEDDLQTTVTDARISETRIHALGDVICVRVIVAANTAIGWTHISGEVTQ
jgi:hypothetical protein